MGVIAEMRISSPPAAPDYQGLKSSGAIFPKSLETSPAAAGAAPSNRDKTEHARLLSGGEVFPVFVDDFCFAGKGKVLKI